MIQNIRTGFKQYITNHYLKNEIDENQNKIEQAKKDIVALNEEIIVTEESGRR